MWRRVVRPPVFLDLPLDPARIAARVPVTDGVYLAGKLETADLPDPGTRALTLFVVNGREPLPNGPQDERCLFQVSLEIACKDGIVARPNRADGEAADLDARIADLAPADADVPMAAILLSTGSPGSEGTLGGLVEQGRNLRRHLRHALDLGELCSNDPVCASHSPQNDYSERHLEGAACHGCLFVAESSCERFNRYLDRSLVVPTLGHPAGLAFFDLRG